MTSADAVIKKAFDMHTTDPNLCNDLLLVAPHNASKAARMTMLISLRLLFNAEVTC